VSATPIDFGEAEPARAFQERGLSPLQITVSIRAGTSESWSLDPNGVIAADERGGRCRSASVLRQYVPRIEHLRLEPRGELPKACILRERNRFSVTRLASSSASGW
jgi:hypothetical protein